MISTIWNLVSHHWSVLAGGSALVGIVIALITAVGPAAVFGMLKVIPRWCWELLIALVLVLAYGAHERGVVQAKFDAYITAQALAGQQAKEKRTEDNALLAKIQIGTSENIQKVKDNEITTLRTAIAQSGRMRVGIAFCPGAAGQTDPHGAGGSDGANPAGWLLSSEMDAAVKSLILEMEQTAATGRAAQAFIKKNGMAPAAGETAAMH